MVGGLFYFDESVGSMMLVDNAVPADTHRADGAEGDGLQSVRDAEDRRVRDVGLQRGA